MQYHKQTYLLLPSRHILFKHTKIPITRPIAYDSRERHVTFIVSPDFAVSGQADLDLGVDRLGQGHDHVVLQALLVDAAVGENGLKMESLVYSPMNCRID